MLHLIVNADDAGYSAERDDGILRCVHHGVVRSVSLLVNGASAASAVAKLSAANPPISIGLHVNVTEGAPVARPVRTVASLLGPDGFFLGKVGFRDAVSRGDVDLAHVVVEAAAQLAAFLALTGGRPPSHFDGHQHIQTAPGVATALAAALTPTVRATRIPALHRGAEGAAVDALPIGRRAFYSEIASQCAAARHVMAHATVAAPAAFVGYSTMGRDCTEERVEAMLDGLLTSTRGDAAADIAVGEGGSPASDCWAEWMVHPGWVTRERPVGVAEGGPPSTAGAPGVVQQPPISDVHSDDSMRGAATAEQRVVGDAGCGQGPDDFSRDPGRECELRVLTDPALAEWLAQRRVVLASYHDFMVACRQTALQGSTA